MGMPRTVTVKRYTSFADMKRDEYRWAQSQPTNTRFVDTLNWTLTNLKAEIKQQDYINLIAKLEKYAVRYLIVGGYAVSYYTQPRFTQDLDIWVEASDEVGSSDFETNAVYPPVAGIEPIKVDVLTTLPGVIFADAWEHRVAAGIAGTKLSAYFISREDLIAAKLASGRLRDLADVDEIREAQTLNSKTGKEGQ
jgi:hypothetical protein